MLDDCLSLNFRNKFKDSDGNGWIYNWFCVDHVDYELNPRRRDIGYHKIFDEYFNILKKLALLMMDCNFTITPTQ